jgi:Fe-S-cluster-containing dehydrogenase component
VTCLPQPRPGQKKLGLVIDLDTCVGCHGCATACKSWNTSGHPGPLADTEPYGASPEGAWLNRVHTFEAGVGADSRTVHFPRSCLHCENAACVTVCPTGASYKRPEDGIVLVNAETCIGCGLCAWACPYGARELDPRSKVMKKCTLCIDRIYNESMDEADRIPACVAVCPTRARHFGDLGDPDSDVSRLVAERGGHGLMPELGYGTVNRYLPPRARTTGVSRDEVVAASRPAAPEPAPDLGGHPFLRWVDRLLSAA